MKIIKTILIVISIMVIIYFFPVIMNEKKELPNGILMSMNRFTKEISIKLPNDEFTCFSKDNPFYKEISSAFNNY